VATGDEGEKPWEGYGRQRLDVEPHRGQLVSTLGLVALACGGLSFCTGVAGLIGLGAGLAAWRMACADVARMLAGQMDRRGEARTRRGGDFGLIGAILSLLGTAVWLALLADGLLPPPYGKGWL